MDCEVVGESVLEDAGVELVVFVDGFEVVAERGPEFVLIENGAVFDEKTQGQFV